MSEPKPVPKLTPEELQELRITTPSDEAAAEYWRQHRGELLISPEAMKDLQSWDESLKHELPVPDGFVEIVPTHEAYSAAELVQWIEGYHSHTPASFRDEIAKYNFSSRPEVPAWLTETPNGVYYRMLAVYGREFRPKRVCEIGTCYGSSAMALSKFNPGTVTTFDINLGNVVDHRMMNDFGIKTVLLRSPTECEALPFHEYDTLFIDIGDHNGKPERVIYERLLRENWKGVAFWDDINWGGMRPLWDSMTVDKCETNWHGTASGFGVTVFK